MAANLLDGGAPRPNHTSVRRVQPNPEGGRPTDALTLAFEGVMEGLVACDDDRRAFDAAAERLRQIRAIQTRLQDELETRASRLFERIEPELRRIAAETDHALTERTEARR